MKTTETLNEMLKKQQEIINGLANSSKAAVEESYGTLFAPFKKASEMLFESMKSQQALLDGANFSSDASENAKKGADYYQNWLALQSEFTEKWLDLYKDFLGSQVTGMQKDQGAKFSNTFKKAYEDWAELMKTTYSKLNNEVKADFDAALKDLPALANFIKAYDDLNGYWKSLLENGIIKGDFSREAFQKYFPEDSFVKVIDSLVGLQSVETFKKNIETYDNFFNSYVSKVQEMQGQVKETTSKVVEQMEGAFVGTAYEPMVKMYNELKGKFSESNAFASDALAQDQMKKMTESYLENRKLYLDYAQKVSNFQQRIYSKSKESMSETLEMFWANYQMKGKTPNYDEFVAQWLKVTQGYISDILDSKELVSLTKDVEGANAKISSAIDAMMQDYVKLFANKESKEAKATTSTEKKKVANDGLVASMEQTETKKGRETKQEEVATK